MIIFKGTAEASMRNATQQLEKAAGSDAESVQDAAFQDAMLSLVNLAVAMHRGDCPSDAALSAFRAQVAELLGRPNNRGNLGAYVADGSSLAGRALQPGAYYQAAIVRTAVQLLIDSYPGSIDWLSQPTRDELEEGDEALREAAEEVPPLPGDSIPEGLPDSHWWWRAPQGDPRTYEMLHGTGEDI